MRRGGGARGGRYSFANDIVAYVETQSNRVFDFHDFCVFFVSKCNPFILLLKESTKRLFEKEGVLI